MLRSYARRGCAPPKPHSPRNRTRPSCTAPASPAADGVFATRSSDRPNPLGLYEVTVLGIDGLELAVGPLEAIDGTPIVDIKPVL
jgi:tRNA (Thr-GGU) A37 N-methylase